MIPNGAFITAAEGGAGLKFTPAADLNSPAGDTFTFTVQAALDAAGTGLSVGTTTTVTVTEVNDAPTGADDTLATVAEDAVEFPILFASLTANDLVGPNENGQSLTVTAVTAVTGGTVTIDGAQVLFTPTADFYGAAEFTYTLQDDGTTNGTLEPKTATAVVRFTITEVNDVPVGVDDTLSDAAEDSGPWTIPFAALLGNDSAGPANESSQTLTISAVGSPVGGTAEIVGTDVIFTPTLNFHGTASFSYTLQDDGTTAGAADPLTATAGVQFTVTPVNDAPVAQDLVKTMIVGYVLTGQVTATDVDGNPLTYAVTAAPTRGTVTMTAAGAFTYRPNSIGTDTFAYKANDGTADSVAATVTITISPEPIVPVLTLTVPVTETRESSILASGTANPFFYVVVNGTTVQANGQGAWSATVTLAEGPNLITAANGPLTQTVTVVRDTTPPVLTLTASATRTDENTAVLTAISEEGARIEIEGQEGSTLTVRLRMGLNRFTATATDQLGNQATATVSVVRVGMVPQVREVRAIPGQPAEAATDLFRVYLPGAAIAEPMLLRISSPTADIAAMELAESVARVAMTGDAETTGALRAPATVTFTYDPTRVSNPLDLRIYYFDPQQNVWVRLDGVVDPTTHTITVQVEHFTTFAAMAPEQDAPILDPLPTSVRTRQLTATGTSTPGTAVTLVINGEAQTTVMTDLTGRFTLDGVLSRGRNFIYVKGTGVLASQEMTVRYLSYTDIQGHWAEAAIQALADREIATLYPEPRFEPDARTTRLEFAVMVARLLGLTPVQEAPAFTDTEAMAPWARPEVAAAVKAGIIRGMPDGSFAPNALVTRAEMAVMLTRALGYAGFDTKPGDRQFVDGDSIPDWAKDQVLAAARYGLVTGYPDGSYQSGNSTTRAEAVTMLNRLLNLLTKE